MNPLRANEIRDRIRETPRDIRVCCLLRGHYITDMTLEVPDGQDEIVMAPHGPEKHAHGRLAGFYGFQMSLVQRRAWPPHPGQDVSVTLTCPHARCSYSGKFRYTTLALPLAAAALAGQREYRVTS